MLDSTTLDFAPRMLHTQLGVLTEAGNTPPTIRGAQKYNERRGTTRTPSKIQPIRKPNFAFKVEFPELPRRQQEQQSAPEPSVGGSMDDFREILDLFRSGTNSSYIRKFKGLMQRVKAQPDSMSKMFTFGLG